MEFIYCKIDLEKVAPPSFRLANIIFHQTMHISLYFKNPTFVCEKSMLGNAESWISRIAQWLKKIFLVFGDFKNNKTGIPRMLVTNLWNLRRSISQNRIFLYNVSMFLYFRTNRPFYFIDRPWKIPVTSPSWKNPWCQSFLPQTLEPEIAANDSVHFFFKR